MVGHLSVAKLFVPGRRIDRLSRHTPYMCLGQGNHPVWPTSLESRKLASYVVPDGRPPAVTVRAAAFSTHSCLPFWGSRRNSQSVSIQTKVCFS